MVFMNKNIVATTTPALNSNNFFVKFSKSFFDLYLHFISIIQFVTKPRTFHLEFKDRCFAYIEYVTRHVLFLN